MRRRSIICCLFFAISLSAFHFAPLQADPKRAPGMRWAHSWAEARDEAWLRDCPILIHMHDDTKMESQKMYAFFQDEKIYKHTERLVNVAYVRYAESHPFARRKDDDGADIFVSRIFNGVTRDELDSIFKQPDEAFKKFKLGNWPNLYCYPNWGGDPKFVVPGELKQGMLRVKIEEAVTKIGNQAIVPLDYFLRFQSEQETFRDYIEEEEWTKAMNACNRMRKSAEDKRYDRFLLRIQDLLDNLNAAGLKEIDKAMEISDKKDRLKQLKSIASDFFTLDAGARADAIVLRLKNG